MGASSEALLQGRKAYAASEWRNAFDALSAADASSSLESGDLLLWARAAYMLGRDDDYVAAMERAHRLQVQGGQVQAAAGTAWWVGHNLLFRGQSARASGWFELGFRLLEEGGTDCVERGWLLAPVWLQQMASGDWAAGLETVREGRRIGERFGDDDLTWLARDDEARALLNLGRIDEGLRLVNELLVVAGAGTLSPVVRGIVYCNTIIFCRNAHQLRQTREWTEALTSWCAAQPQMVAHNALCLVHKAEILQVQGDWSSALEEARVAATRYAAGVLNSFAIGRAHYLQAEIHRLRGRFYEAELAYQEANRFGFEPQPGLALMRLEQGRTDAAAAAIRRSVAEHVVPHERAALLPAYVRIMLEVGDEDAARTACNELEQLASQASSESLVATTDHARALLAQAMKDGPTCLRLARSAWRRWVDMDAPYDAACARVLIAEACRWLGDEDSEALETQAAVETFTRLGARPDLERMSSPTRASSGTSGLSARELEVLRFLVSGRTNRQIASDLVISERTVARHLQNIFAKLGVSTRTAASAFAHEHHLV